MHQTNIIQDCYSGSDIRENINILRIAKRYEKIGLVIGLPAFLINIFAIITCSFYVSKLELFFNFINAGKLEMFIIFGALMIMYINPLIEIFLGFIGISAILNIEDEEKAKVFRLSVINIIIGFSSYLMTMITIISSLKFFQAMMFLLF